MIEESAGIVLTTDIPEHGLKEGDIGTVVLIHGNGEGYEVEFMILDGETVAVVSLYAWQFGPRAATRLPAREPSRPCSRALNIYGTAEGLADISRGQRWQESS